MKTKLIFFLLFPYFCFSNKDFNLDSFIEILYNFSLNDYEDEYINRNINTFNKTFIKYSGKDIGEIGNEISCKTSSGIPFLITFPFKPNETFFEKNVIEFLEFSTHYIGICINEKFINLTGKLFNHSVLFDKFGMVLGAEMGNKIKSKSNNNKIEFYYPQPYDTKLYIKIAVYVSLGILVVKVFCALIRIVFLSTFIVSLPSQLEIFPIIKYKNQSESEGSEQGNVFLFKDPNKIAKSFTSEEALKDVLDESNKPICHKLINFFEIIKDIEFLFTCKNKYYSEEGIQVLATMRFFVMILTILENIVHSSKTIPGKDCFNEQFYLSIFYSFINLSFFSFHYWMILDSAIMTFKLFSYLKKQMQAKNCNSPSIMMFIWFFLRTIPKIFLFLVIFFVYSYHIQSLTPFLGSSNLYNYLSEKYYKERECIKERKFWIIFHPYTFYKEENHQIFNKCFKFVYFTINQFYSFIFFLILLYIVLKLRKRSFEIFIMVGILVNSVLSFLSCHLPIKNEDGMETNYTKSFHEGATENVKLIHLFINFYFLGAFIGICFFYYFDSVSNYLLHSTMNYTPFEFCFIFIGFLDRQKLIVKYILIIVIIIITCPVAMHFYIFTKKQKRLIINFHNPILVLFFYYESYILCILFSVLCILILLIPKEEFLGKIFKSNFFSYLNRFSSVYFYSGHTILYLTFALSNIYLKLSYINEIIQTIGFFMETSVICVVFTILYELPLRKLIKNIDWFFNNKDNWDSSPNRTSIIQGLND